MATSLETRVRTLERGGLGKCPECGFDGDRSKVTAVFEEAGDRPKNSGTCGRAWRIVLAWGGRA